MTGLGIILGYWRGHGTKILGGLAAIIPGLLGIDQLIPASQTKYWLAAGVVIGALTIQRGFSNSKQEIINVP